MSGKSMDYAKSIPLNSTSPSYGIRHFHIIDLRIFPSDERNKSFLLCEDNI